jgi:hypothetical protein
VRFEGHLNFVQQLKIHKYAHFQENSSGGNFQLMSFSVKS